jgi:DNA-binding LacI/PurR family transcriptional regulator
MKQRCRQQPRIVRDIRAAILSGRHGPGSRLPTQKDYERRFGVDSMTIQRALAVLGRDGFIEAKGRRGTFVANTLPYRQRVGLVSEEDLDRPEVVARRKYSTFLYDQLRQQCLAGGLELAPYFGVDAHADNPHRQRLHYDLDSRRLAGVFLDQGVLLRHPHLEGILRQARLPVVTSSMEPSHPNWIAVGFDRLECLDTGLEMLRRAGRRRVALLDTGGDDELEDRFRRAVRRLRLVSHPYWVQGVPADVVSCARNLVNLLLIARPRPDALFISDDSLVEAASLGIRDAQVRVPRDLALIAYANFPYQTPCHVPAVRIGWDLSAAVAAGFDALLKRRDGQPAPRQVVLKPILEGCLPGSG